jgi:RNA polymerase sigma-70 factor (ECF subfamily)
VSEQDWLAERFDAERARLRAVAYRLLGSASEAEDAVQDVWLRASRHDADRVDNLSGWLTTITGRICLDRLRNRRRRGEQPLDERLDERTESDPEANALAAESVGAALVIVLDRLTPAERIAFVLHDVFDLPFDQIAGIVGRSTDATKMLASRARRRVRSGDRAVESSLARQRELVEAFLAAARDGRIDALLKVLDPAVVVRADPGAVAPGAPTTLHGAAAVSEQALVFSARATHARVALVDGTVGLVVGSPDRPRVVLRFVTRAGRIVGLDIVADPDRVRALDVADLP